jgi:hypothetical protein
VGHHALDPIWERKVIELLSKQEEKGAFFVFYCFFEVRKTLTMGLQRIRVTIIRGRHKGTQTEKRGLETLDGVEGK